MKTRFHRAVTSLVLVVLSCVASNAWAMYDPSTCNPNNPTFVDNNFTPAQKQAQRTAGQIMMEALVKAAKAGDASYTIVRGLGEVNRLALIKLK